VQSLARDGVTLRYEHVEGSLTPVVLVHGWCCDHTYLAPQFEYLGDLGHAVVALDLRGHGESDKPEGAYSMDVFADDLAWLSRELGLERPVIVGHSMGGVVAFELAIRHSDLPGAIVMIDSPVARPEASRQGMPAFLEKLNGPEYREALLSYVEEVLFLPTDEAEHKAEILARMPETERHVMIAAFEGLRDFDPDAARGPLEMPSLFIAADDKPLSDLPHLFQLAPDMLFGQTVGSGHFCTLEVPEQINPMLARFLALLPSLNGSPSA
jgi:pimeloyl-ACP methyl ester carboxylesterase